MSERVLNNLPAQNLIRIVLFACFAMINGSSLALPPIPEPYPVELPVESLPAPYATPGSIRDLPAPLPIPWVTPTPRAQELNGAGAEKPNEHKIIEAVLVENTPKNVSKLREYAEDLGLRGAWEFDKYILIDIGLGEKIGPEAAKKLGKWLGRFEAVYAVYDIHNKTGSFEQTFHQFIRESFALAGGTWAGTAAVGSGVGAGWVTGAQFVGAEIGRGVAEVVIWTGVTLGDTTRSAYDYTKAQVIQKYTAFRNWWKGDPLPDPKIPGADQTPGGGGNGPNPMPVPTPTPTPGGPSDPKNPGGSGGGNGPTPAPLPTPTPTPSGPGGPEDPSNPGGGSNNSNGLPPLPEVYIFRPAGWGVN